MNALLKLLASIVNLTRAGGLKNIDQVYGIAKRELGDKFNAAKKQIDMAFKEGQKQKKLDDRTKDIKKIDESVVSEGIETLVDTKSGKSIMDQIQESKTKIEDASSKISKAQKEIDEMYRPKTDEEIEKKFNDESELMKRLEEKIKNMQNVENISTGLTRTIAREILSKRGIDIPKGRDAIELFREKFGQDVLIDVNNLAEELVEMDRMGKKPKSLTQIIEQEGFFDVKMPKEPPQGYTPEELAEIQKEIEQEDILLKFDTTGRKSNSMGGINRVRYAQGKLKIIQFLAGKGKNLMDQIKESIDNLFLSGDPKYDADVVVDDVLEQFGVDREMFDQKDIIDTYGKAYDMIVKGARETDEIKKMAPKMVERLEIKAKYPGIDEELVDKILIDDNPQRKAELLATLDEAFRMLEKGKGADEIIDTFKNQSRTKQAMGTGPDGLSEITDLYEKIRIKNVQTQKDKEDNKQMRFRKLLASNKFPELNTFLEAELNEDDEKVELDVRTNLAVGGSPFTAEQLAQKKQQSYLDYLARQGATAAASTGAGYRGGASSVGTNLFSTPATSTTTTETSTTTGGTSGGGTTSPGPTSPGTVSTGSGGMTSGGSSTGSSGGGTSSGGNNVYTGAGNFPPGMGTNTGGGSTSSSGGGSGLTPNTGNSNVGGGGFGGTGSIVGGGTGSTGTTGSAPSYQSRLDEYKAYVEKNKNDPKAALSPNSFFSQKELLANPELQDAAYKNVYNPGREFQKQVQAGYDTGDLGSEAANIAANQAASALPNPYEMSSKELRAAAQPFIDQAKAEWFAANPGATAQDFSRSGGRWIDLAEDIVRRNYNEQQDQFAATGTDQDATADDGFEVFTDSAGNKRISEDQYNQAKLEFLKSEGKISQDATVNDLASQEGGPRNTSLNEAAKEYIENKYGTSSTLSPNAKTAYTQMGGGADFAQITSLPETTQVAQSIQGESDDKNILQKANEFATKHGKTITAASYLLDSVAPGAGKIIRTAQALNKGYNLVTGAVDSAMNDVITKPTGIGGQVDLNETLSKGTTSEPEYDGNIGSIFFSDGGRVNKAVGGSLDLEARRKQSYADYLARQPGAQPAQPQEPTAQPAQPVVPQPVQPAASQPFDMSKYQGGTFTGGVEDSRNIALGDLAELGVDISKYRTMSAKKDPTAPTFQGYTNMEIMMMAPEEAKQKLGFDPGVEGANPEFEKFIQSEFDRTGPMAIGPGGPAGVTTEFKNQDELSQILNRAIPFYMRTARDLGENYTLQEMLAMTDEELAALDDRYDKKMGYGKYRKTSPNIYNTGSTDKSQAQETMEYYSGNIQPQGTGIGLGSQYATGGRVGFRYGGEKKRVKKYMKPNYDQPFDKISKSEKSKFNKLTSTLSSYAKNLNKLKKKKATTAAQKNLLVQNEKARKNALKRLDLLKKMYSGSKRV